MTYLDKSHSKSNLFKQKVYDSYSRFKNFIFQKKLVLFNNLQTIQPQKMLLNSFVSNTSLLNYQNHCYYSTTNSSNLFTNVSTNEVDMFFKQFYSFFKKLTDEYQTTNANLSSQFTHFDNQTNLPKQVDVSEKQANTVRIACASGYIQLNQETFEALVQNKLKKGNAFIVAQLAGIQASKQTANLIPLCHSIMLDKCQIDFRVDADKNRIICEAICKTTSSKTGVEMEALTACSISLLTIYDMCKAVQKDASINSVRLEYKYGGKSDFKLDEKSSNLK